MLWRLLFIALIAGAQCMMSNRCPESAGDLTNTANSITSQSSNYTDEKQVSYSSGRATDGNTTACAHTKKELGNHWWRIDLLGVYDIYCVSIYSDAGENTNVNGAQIHVGNSRENSDTNNKMCARTTNFNKEQWNDFTCTERVSGRYVTVSFPGTRPLILCEVKIYGKKRDLIYTIVWKSSTSTVNSDSQKHVDGPADPCTTITPHTPSNAAWWTAQLPAVYQISCVSIFSIDQIGTIMTGAHVQILVGSYNSSINSKICANITNFIGGQWNDFRCAEKVSGRYITVFSPGTRPLILCEMKIYRKKKDLINTANSTTSQSSDLTTDFPFNSGRAADGNKTQCASTKDKLGDHWWRIDLLGVYNISFVSIYNKIEHNTNMTGAQIHVGNSRENNGTNNKMCANITHFEVGQWNDFKCADRVSGRYVTVFLPQQIGLILCEVEIYGKKKESPFELIQENKTWEHALQHCRDNNMDLATILDEEDQVLAELEAQRAKTLFLWLGLHYTCILEVWFWVADYRLEFNRWAPGGKTGDCDRSAVMRRDEGHQWFSKSDYDEFNFICQKF